MPPDPTKLLRAGSRPARSFLMDFPAGDLVGFLDATSAAEPGFLGLQSPSARPFSPFLRLVGRIHVSTLVVQTSIFR